MITRQANPINDPEVIDVLKGLLPETLFSHPFPSPAGEWQEQFFEGFENWRPRMGSSSILGLEAWSRYIIQGTTESFQNFDLYYSDRQTFVLKGEYPYHQQVGAQVVVNYSEIPNSGKLILSYPFSASGEVPEKWDSILQYCTSNNIPVLLDCALIHLAELPSVDVREYPCIHWVAFSFSKNYCSGRFRSGVLYCRSELAGVPIAVVNEWSYLNHLSLNIHLQLMARFEWNHLLTKYRKFQEQVCRELKVRPSSCVLFGLSAHQHHDEFKRSNGVRRLCLSQELMQRLSGADDEG